MNTRDTRDTHDEGHDDVLTEAASGEQHSRESNASPEQMPIEAKPTIRPVVIWMAIAILLAIGIIAYIWTHTDSFGGQETAEILMKVVGVVGLLVLIRLAIRVFILRRTTYTVSADYIKRTYSLFLRTWERQVPVDMVRSYELHQNRLQRLMGYGTITINRGLGDIRLENVQQPHDIHDALGSVFERQSRWNL